METAKKGGRAPVNGQRKVSARLVNGHLVGQSAQTKWSKFKVWDVSWYNFLQKKWVPEGGELTYRQAYARASYLAKNNPYSQLSIVLVPGLTKKLNKVKTEEKADA